MNHSNRWSVAGAIVRAWLAALLLVIMLLVLLSVMLPILTLVFDGDLDKLRTESMSVDFLSALKSRSYALGFFAVLYGAFAVVWVRHRFAFLFLNGLAAGAYFVGLMTLINRTNGMKNHVEIAIVIGGAVSMSLLFGYIISLMNRVFGEPTHRSR